ncbi:hypothetical protein COL10_31425 [Bacillus cereus]|nr:hypothetical protein CN468_30315 [Bacillus cereus]PFD62953.1 hypothetical protein CN301_31160 [Bacillus cereus]PFK29817.1 hypothetical protein COJ18_30470 [Bacillus cereus]PFV00304.1 hypothetical protein COL10_31425 [Bacillus cereus]PGK36804.1 hypothetical protein CN909_29695 [Bacillus cereus]
MIALLVQLIFYAGTKWHGFRTSFSSFNVLYQVIKGFHIANLYAEPIIIFHLSLATSFELEEGEFFWGIR